jgi:CysZ protein
MGVFTGLSALLSGFGLLFHPRLRAWVFLPILINLVVFALLAWLSVEWLTTQIQAVVNLLPGWLSFLSWLMWALATLMMVLIFGVTFTTLTLLVGAPFYVVLTQRAMAVVSDEPLPETQSGAAGLTLEVAKAMLRELRKILRILPRLVLALIVSLIPVLNVISPFVWLYINSWIFAFQFLDYPLDARARPLSDTRAWMRNHRGASLGIGFGIGLCAGVPLLNVIAFPAAIIGACQLVESSREL